MYNPSPIPKGQIACIPCVVALCEEVCIITVVSPTLRRRCIYIYIFVRIVICQEGKADAPYAERGRSTRFSPLHPSEEATHSLRREEDRGESFIFGYMHHRRAINIGFLTANIAIKR